MSTADDIRGWQNFFMLTGGASATLMGLVFLSVSLASELEDYQRASLERRIFVTPIVFQYSYALVLSAMSVAPWTSARSYGVASMVIGVAATFQSIVLLRRMLERRRAIAKIDGGSWTLSGLAPMISAVTLMLGGLWMVVADRCQLALVGVGVLMLDLFGVTNSWRLLIWMLGNRRTR